MKQYVGKALAALLTTKRLGWIWGVCDMQVMKQAMDGIHVSFET